MPFLNPQTIEEPSLKHGYKSLKIWDIFLLLMFEGCEHLLAIKREFNIRLPLQELQYYFWFCKQNTWSESWKVRLMFHWHFLHLLNHPRNEGKHIAEICSLYLMFPSKESQQTRFNYFFLSEFIYNAVDCAIKSF